MIALVPALFFVGIATSPASVLNGVVGIDVDGRSGHGLLFNMNGQCWALTVDHLAEYLDDSTPCTATTLGGRRLTCSSSGAVRGRFLEIRTGDSPPDFAYLKVLDESGFCEQFRLQQGVLIAEVLESTTEGELVGRHSTGSLERTPARLEGATTSHIQLQPANTEDAFTGGDSGSLLLSDGVVLGVFLGSEKQQPRAIRLDYIMQLLLKGEPNFVPACGELEIFRPQLNKLMETSPMEAHELAGRVLQYCITAPTDQRARAALAVYQFRFAEAVSLFESIGDRVGVARAKALQFEHQQTSLPIRDEYPRDQAEEIRSIRLLLTGTDGADEYLGRLATLEARIMLKFFPERAYEAQILLQTAARHFNDAGRPILQLYALRREVHVSRALGFTVQWTPGLLSQFDQSLLAGPYKSFVDLLQSPVESTGSYSTLIEQCEKDCHPLLLAWARERLGASLARSHCVQGATNQNAPCREAFALLARARSTYQAFGEVQFIDSVRSVGSDYDMPFGKPGVDPTVPPSSNPRSRNASWARVIRQVLSSQHAL